MCYPIVIDRVRRPLTRGSDQRSEVTEPTLVGGHGADGGNLLLAADVAEEATHLAHHALPRQTHLGEADRSGQVRSGQSVAHHSLPRQTHLGRWHGVRQWRIQDLPRRGQDRIFSLCPLERLHVPSRNINYRISHIKYQNIFEIIPTMYYLPDKDDIYFHSFSFTP